MDEPHHDVFAIRYARSILRHDQATLLGDPHDGDQPIVYYVWVIREPSSGAVTVVDTGFSEERARLRQRALERTVAEGLAAVGVDPAGVGSVILTHLHFDHAGNIGLFPNAEFVLQDREMAYATGRDMRFALVRRPFEADDVVDAVRATHAGRVRFVDGEELLAPGISVMHVGGHSRGLQVVLVSTRRGRVILASDAAHFFQNITRGLSFPIVADVAQNLESHERLLRLAESADHVIPGHDPLVLELYPKAEGDDGSVVLSADPLGPSPLADLPAFR